jgi:hypothetical protein
MTLFSKSQIIAAYENDCLHVITASALVHYPLLARSKAPYVHGADEWDLVFVEFAGKSLPSGNLIDFSVTQPQPDCADSPDASPASIK